MGKGSNNILLKASQGSLIDENVLLSLFSKAVVEIKRFSENHFARQVGMELCKLPLSDIENIF